MKGRFTGRDGRTRREIGFEARRHQRELDARKRRARKLTELMLRRRTA